MTPNERLKEGFLLAIADIGNAYRFANAVAKREVMDKLTEENVEKQMKVNDSFTEDQDATARMLQTASAIHIEKDGCGQFVSNGDLEAMQNDYNQLVSDLRASVNMNRALSAEKTRMQAVIDDDRENLRAAKKLRKEHERRITLLEAELAAADAWKEHAKALSVLNAVQSKVKRAEALSHEACERFETLKKRYAPKPATTDEG